ncbi:MAG: DUF3309 domain-containing protein [Gemmataceae bacterium]|nr:DUF3309 domain-containing protein [Gemmataceae bacterium]MCI0740462.1 DUF3309 domain-containing protein [Gemmataceae bacterium]
MGMLLVEAGRVSEHFSQLRHRRKGDFMGLLLLIILIVLLLGGLPNWGYSRNWGYGPSGVLGLVLVVAVILILTGYIRVGV